MFNGCPISDIRHPASDIRYAINDLKIMENPVRLVNRCEIYNEFNLFNLIVC